MGIEATLEMEHLARYCVGYDAYRDVLTFLPFVYDRNERMSSLAVEAHPVTACGTIEELYLRRSSNMAGIQIRYIRSIIAHHALELHERNGRGVEGLDSLTLLELAEAYAAALAKPGADLTTREKEIKRLRSLLEHSPIIIPPEVACLIR